MLQLIERLNSQFTNEQITNLLHEARAAALAEAQVLLKDAMVKALLARVQDELKTVEPAVVTLPSSDLIDPQDQLRREIAEIRRQIAENERLMGMVEVEPSAAPFPVAGPRIEMTETELVPELITLPDAESDAGYYVYGIIEEVKDLDVPPRVGIDPKYPVYTLPYGKLCAVVSQVSLQEFGTEALEERLRDMTWLETRVYAHQAILDDVLARNAVIPFRFGTIYQSEGRVRELLATRYAALLAALVQLKGRQEWGVKLSCDVGALRQQIDTISPKLQALRAEIDGKAEGAAYFLQKRLEQVAAAEIERYSDDCARHSHAHLAACAVAAVTNATQRQELTGNSATMILNGAYLVATEKFDDFRTELEHLGMKFSELGFSYELTGPWPPYNFVQLADAGAQLPASPVEDVIFHDER